MPEKICCITYTKAAAGEMRERVLASLRELLLLEEADCRVRITELTGQPASDEILARARQLFAMVLDSPSGGIQLTTIHGFCQNILARFPLEAGISPHFTVLEDEAATRLLARVKHQLLEGYRSEDTALNAAFECIGGRGSEARFDGYVSAILAQRGAWEEIWRGQNADSLRAVLYDLHGLAADVCEEGLMAEFAMILSPEEESQARALLPALLASTKKETQRLAGALAAWLELAPDLRPTIADELIAACVTDAGTVRKIMFLKKEFPESSPVHTWFAAVAERMVAFHKQRASLAAAEESFAVALVSRALLALYAQAKAEMQALDYEDLIGKTRELLANPAMIGWVMSKLDHRIDHLLIDEAQDTSREQWRIAHALVEELIANAGGIGSGNLPRSLLVVGDEKQSIYSFQGAAPELFEKMKGRFSSLLSGSGAPMNEESLTTSYRSAEAVLRVVDAVAARPEITRALHATGMIHPHGLKRAHAAGTVVLYPTILAPEKQEIEGLSLPMEYSFSQQASAQLAESIAAQIEAWLAEGRMLQSEGRALEAGDILILVRNRTSLVLALIRALQRRKVPVAGLDRLKLSAHLAVRDLLALMRFVLNPADDLALAHVLRSPLIGWSDEALRAQCVGRTGSLWARLEAGETPALLRRALRAKEMTPYAFLTEILEVAGTRRGFAERFGEEVHEVLDELKNQAAAMPSELPQTLDYFHDWMEGSGREIKREQESGGSDAVRIMTVHGAKGLEAPVVILADTVGVPTTQHEKIFFAENVKGQRLPVLAISDEAKVAPVLEAAKAEKKQALIDEYYRLFYVALTRARDELHLFGAASRKGSVPDASWYAMAEAALAQLGAKQEEGKLMLVDQRAAMPPVATVVVDELPALPAWAQAAIPAQEQGIRRVSPSQLVSEVEISPYVREAAADSRARGVILHRVLELLGTETDAATVAKLIALLAPEWSEGERKRACAEVTTLYMQERWIWQSPAHAEVAVAGTLTIHGESVAVNGQIDRLIELPEAVVVLDYKTGRHIPSSAQALSENYRVQLKTYHALVAPLYPGKPVRTAILWTAAPLLMWCDEAVAATVWPVQNPVAA